MFCCTLETKLKQSEITYWCVALCTAHICFGNSKKKIKVKIFVLTPFSLAYKIFNNYTTITIVFSMGGIDYYLYFVQWASCACSIQQQQQQQEMNEINFISFSCLFLCAVCTALVCTNSHFILSFIVLDGLQIYFRLFGSHM